MKNEIILFLTITDMDPQKYGRTIKIIVNNFIDDRIFASKAFIIHKTHIHM